MVSSPLSTSQRSPTSASQRSPSLTSQSYYTTEAYNCTFRYYVDSPSFDQDKEVKEQLLFLTLTDSSVMLQLRMRDPDASIALSYIQMASVNIIMRYIIYDMILRSIWEKYKPGNSGLLLKISPEGRRPESDISKQKPSLPGLYFFHINLKIMLYYI